MNPSNAEKLTILVTGANGFVGRALLRRLQGDGRFSVRAAVRNQTGLGPIFGVEIIETGDLSANTDWRAGLHGVDAVIHLAARVHQMRDAAADPLAEFRKVNVDGTLHLAEQAQQAGVKRFIFISSIKVNGEETLPGRPFRADDAPFPMDAYGIAKREAEDGLRALCANASLDYVIIRPPLVYGPGAKGNFSTLLRCVNKGIPLPLAAIDNRRSLIAADNLADLIVTCIGHSGAANQTFLASDGEDLSTPDLLARVARALGKRSRLWPVSPKWLSFAARCLGKSAAAQKLCGSLQVDIEKTQARLDWQPPVSVDTALAATARHFLGVSG